MRDPYLFILLVRLGVVAALASILVRSEAFKRMLMREERTLPQRLYLAAILAAIFGAGVATRVVTRGYDAVDFGLEASLISGIIGGYVSGLLAGALIALPATFNGEYLALPVLAGIGALGGLLRNCAPDAEEVWKFTPFVVLTLPRIFSPKHDHRQTAFQLFFMLTVFWAEFLRQALGSFTGRKVIFFLSPPEGSHPLLLAATYTATLFCVFLPLKIWANARNERKLEEQKRLVVEARLQALSTQINPHFLFNTLNSVSSLIRTNPEQARNVVVKLSRILRSLLRKTRELTSLREELKFIEDYLSIELVRFGDKLSVETDMAPDTLDVQVPSMLLQPLVENSIRHGLSSKVEGGTLRLASRLEGDRIRLVVEDNGVGIPEEKLARLFEQGIGVSNVNERLKVLYGSNYRMWINSTPGQGARIEIEFPAARGEPAAELPAPNATTIGSR
jgi:two-component system, LytTR family, sensor kinase